MKTELNSGMLTIYPKGRIDTITTPEFEASVTKMLTPEVRCVLIQMNQVTYISSAGLRVLLKIKKSVPNTILVGVTDEVLDVLHITGMDELFGLGIAESYENGPVEDHVREHSAESKTAATSTEHMEGMNDTTDVFPFVSVVSMFEENVKNHPDKLAVVSTETCLTYRMLNEMANRVANSLLFLGIQPDDIVCIMLPRSVETYVAGLGVLKAGAAFTIVNVAYPDDRIEYIYNDAGCRYLITNKRTVIDKLELVADTFRKRPLYMEELLSNQLTINPRMDIRETDLCYMIYTSGSTGKPKGVMIEHGNLSNFVWPSPKNIEANGITQKGHVLLAMAQMTFDVSVMEEFLGLTGGLTVALALEDEIVNPMLMRDFMISHQVDAVCFTPAYANTLFGIPEMRDALKNIITYDFGAEAFPGSLYTKIMDVNPDAYVMNGYGPTEATISCTVKVLNSPDQITIGKPNVNVYAFIVDESCHEVPKGEIGELLICGRGVGRGYKNLPEKTAESFITFRGMRGYRTGDLACINEQDEIEFHGRRDSQVKLRGLRIELGEVEQIIASHTAVKECAVKVYDNRVLCAYYTLEASASAEEIKAFAAKQLAHYMIPDVFVELAEMPLTANKKIDKAALPKPEIQEAELIPPANETQQKLLDVFKRVYPDEPMGVNTNLLDIGLSSLDTMLLAAHLEAEFGISVRFADIQENPSVLLMEQLVISRKSENKKGRKECHILRGPSEQILDVCLQLGSSTAWNINYICEFPPETSPEKLRDAARQVFAAHAALWAKVEINGDNKTLVELPQPHDLSIEIIRCEETSFDAEGLVQPFELDNPPYFRAGIYVSESKVRLFSDFHHLISDYDSISLLLKEICDAYDGKPVIAERFTMFDLLSEQNDYLENGGMDQSMDLYRRIFENNPNGACIVPDRKEDSLRLAKTILTAPLTADELDKLLSPARIAPATFFTAMMGIVFAKANGVRDVCLQVVFNGRNDIRLTNTFGCIASLIYCVCSWNEKTTVLELIRNLQLQMVETMGLIVQPMNKVRAAYPALEVCTSSYLVEPAEELRIGGKPVICKEVKEQGAGGTTHFFQETILENGKYQIGFEYRADLFSPELMRKITDSYNDMMKNLQLDMTVDELARYCKELTPHE